VRCSGSLAENVALSLIRGSRGIAVSGYLVQSSELGLRSAPNSEVVLLADEVGVSLRNRKVQLNPVDSRWVVGCENESPQCMFEAESIKEDVAEFVFEMAEEWCASAESLVFAGEVTRTEREELAQIV
jgi:hypothetical protein